MQEASISTRSRRWHRMKPKWRARFEFFDSAGNPDSKEARSALGKMRWKKRRVIDFNWYTFFFGPFHMLALGLWRKALVMTLALIGIDLIVLALVGEDRFFGRALNTAAWSYCASTVNYSYYLKKLRGKTGWNPFRPD